MNTLDDVRYKVFNDLSFMAALLDDVDQALTDAEMTLSPEDKEALEGMLASGTTVSAQEFADQYSKGESTLNVQWLGHWQM